MRQMDEQILQIQKCLQQRKYLDPGILRMVCVKFISVNNTDKPSLLKYHNIDNNRKHKR